ncbi:hypothetical protein NE237_015923 [Protea cynaroides]|uniref:Reverse transcriptase domain-containing protein n=1 Tax=Protea cynaroides TaxID=273540 RepID=A0A9Q0QRH5_9MAGN|nr:hypothetical protein NE237_015923 [Protea cynaroides]
MNGLCWNIRGYNDPLKRKAIRKRIKASKCSFVVILDSKIKEDNILYTCHSIAKGWDCIHNCSVNGTARIIIGWDPNIFSLVKVAASNQLIHCQVNIRNSNKAFWLSAIYAANDPINRGGLWNHIETLSTGVNMPWILMGDFNIVRSKDEKMGGKTINTSNTDAFNSCIVNAGLHDLRWGGCHFTWSNKQFGDKRISCKLDRVMINSFWEVEFQGSDAKFLPQGISDHSPAVITMEEPLDFGPKPFKFFNCWAANEGFLPTVKEAWARPIREGMDPLSSLMCRLKAVKEALKIWNWTCIGDVFHAAKEAEDCLSRCQAKLDKDPLNQNLMEEEKEARMRYAEASSTEESFLKQKSRNKWLKLGDRNNKFFFHSVKSNQHRSMIRSIKNDEGRMLSSPSDIKIEAESFFKNMFGVGYIESNDNHPLVKIQSVVDEDSKIKMMAPVQKEEIKQVIFGFSDSKAPGPDGFNAFFYKKSWPIIGNDVSQAIIWFFENPFMPRCANSTFLCLIPKCNIPSKFSDFRPIALCNVIYKIIAKITASRIQMGLDKVISANQSAFITNRSISDNILICHEIVRAMDRKGSSPMAVLKIDLNKAYDSLDRGYLIHVMKLMGFPPMLIRWVSACISTAMFSVLINGSPWGYFKGGWGIRQGDPMSPYLFTISMQPLSVMFEEAVLKKELTLALRCKPINLSHLLFVDDLMVFSKGTVSSVIAAMKIIDKFSLASRMKVNHSKSSIIMGGVSSQVRSDLIACCQFSEGSLPIKYLGLPLLASRLSHKDCGPIIEKIQSSIEGWKCRLLSYAGRALLISAVLQGTLIYWSGIYGLPKKTIKTIDSLLARFLWSGASLSKKAHFISWEKVCRPRNEGGLGIRWIVDINRAGILKLFWFVASNKTSLWVSWVKKRYLKHDTIWSVKVHINRSWAWRSILKCRPFTPSLVDYRIGSGESTFFWLDPWLPGGLLNDRISDYEKELWGIPKMGKVSCVLIGNGWQICPSNSPSARQIWNEMVQVNRDHILEDDRILWNQEKSQKFTSKSAWNAVRNHHPKINWEKAVWFKGSVLDCLPSSDQLIKRNVKVTSECCLCRRAHESVNHLFLSCDFSLTIWKSCISLSTNHCNIPPFSELVNTASWVACNLKTIGKVLFCSSIYHIWRERNKRKFARQQRIVATLAQVIINEAHDIMRANLKCSSSSHVGGLILENWDFKVN